MSNDLMMTLLIAACRVDRPALKDTKVDEGRLIGQYFCYVDMCLQKITSALTKAHSCTCLAIMSYVPVGALVSALVS